MITDFVYWNMLVGIWLMGWILGYRDFERKRNSLALCVHTNGMGHVIQTLRILDVLNKASVKVNLVVLAEQRKIPEVFLIKLREKVGPECEIVDLAHEVHYDDNNGGSISNIGVCIEAFWKIYGPAGWRTVKQCSGLLMKHRPEVCLSLWDPHLPIMIDAFGAKTAVLQVATQAIMYEQGRGTDLVLDMLYLFNVGRKGDLLPLTFSQQPGAMPIVVDVPPRLPAEPYLVAYSCMPDVLVPLVNITKHKVVLFAKDVEILRRWREHKAVHPGSNVEVVKVGATFQMALAKSSGLIASPSPGAVIQALACAKPCFLFVPPGHLEQTMNYNYYARHFVGVSTTASGPIEEWADGAMAMAMGDGPTARTMVEQSERVRAWLDAFDAAADRTLIRALRRLFDEAKGSWPKAEEVAPVSAA